MKTIIKDNEIGFLMKNGRFEKLLKSGRYNITAFLGYTVEKEECRGEVQFNSVPYSILAQDSLFSQSTVRYEIPDGYIGFIYKNGNLISATIKQEYVFWNIFDRMEIRLVSMDETEIKNLSKAQLEKLPIKYYSQIVVSEGEVALIYYDKIYKNTVGPGAYYFWNYNTSVTGVVVNVKWKELLVAGQEILTKDKVGIRMNINVNYRIVDAKESYATRKDTEKQLYSFVQMAVRELAGEYKLDEILERKVELSDALNEKLKKNEGDFFVEFQEAGIKDIILPGEIRDIMNTVLIAEKKAQANVIERREEVASTSSLLNTLKLMDENATLYQLKRLEYLERICSQVGEISVSGKGDLIDQLSKLI